MNRQVEYSSRGRYSSIKDAIDLGNMLNSTYFTTNGERYGIALLIPTVNLQTQEGGLKLVAFKHFSEFTKSDAAYYIKYVVPESDVLNACLGPAIAPGLTQLSGAWTFLVDDFDGEFLTKFPIDTLFDEETLIGVVPYVESLSGLTTGSEGQANGVDYIKGTQYFDGTTEVIFASMDFQGIKVAGGAVCYIDGVNRVIATNAVATAMGMPSQFSDITKIQNWTTIFQDGEDIWQICVEAPIPTIPS